MKNIRIEKIRNQKQWKLFVETPWALYSSTPQWVPPLKADILELLNVSKHPYYRHASIAGFLAYQGDQIVGRIVAVDDPRYREFQNQEIGFFGFYESVDDHQVCHMLFEAAKKWLSQRGLFEMIGPLNPGTNYECGLLIDGFNYPPSVMMPYTASYYPSLFEKIGLSKAKDLYAYKIPTSAEFSHSIQAHAKRLKHKTGVSFRSIDMRKYDSEVKKIHEIYNDAWETNWGFVPMTPLEFHHMAKQMKLILNPDLLLIAEVEGEAVGFGLALPDIHQALIKNKKGKLLPGILRLLWGLKGPVKRKVISEVRVITLGVKKEFMGRALGPLFYMEFLNRAHEQGYSGGEASWILEDNVAMNKALMRMGAERYKSYRIYQMNWKR